MLTTPQPEGFAERLHRLIRQAFDQASLEILLWFRFQQRLDQITPAGAPFDTVVFRLVLWADQQSRLLDLARAVVAERPGRPEAAQLLADMEAATSSASPQLEGLQSTGSEDVLESLGALARAYERIRRVMPPGAQRTIVMDEMVVRMGALPTAHLRLPDRFHLSPSTGDRLAAVVALRRQPDERYLRWLSERLAVEAPFIGYHAAVALRESGRALADGCLNAVETAVGDALKWSRHLPVESDRRKVLQNAIDLVITRTTRT